MLRSATISTPIPDRLGRRARGCVCAAAVLALLGGGAPVPAQAAAGKTTTFTGRIASGTRADANLRGAVRLVLHASAAQDPPTTGPFAVHHYRFTVTVRAPSCSGHPPSPPRRCVSLSGSLSGTALVTLANPDLPRTAQLSGQGRVAPLGAVKGGGTAVGLGFIRTGRFQLTLRLRGSSGSVTIKAQGPPASGFASPF